MSTTLPPRLKSPVSVFDLAWSQLPSGKLALEIWVKQGLEETAFRGLVDAAFKITLDPADASLATGAGTYQIPSGWTGMVGGGSTIIAVMFNSIESTTTPGQQIYTPPKIETSGERAGMQKLLSLELDVKPLVKEISPVSVQVDYFTDDTAQAYAASSSAPGSMVISKPNFKIEVSGTTVITGDESGNTLDAGVSARALVLGRGGDDTASNLSAGDTFIGGQGTDLARLGFASAGTVTKLAGPALVGSVASAAGSSFEPGYPLFAIGPAGTDLAAGTLVQAEAVQFAGASSAVNPLSLLNLGGPLKLVGTGGPSSFSSLKLALASATAGDAIVVSPDHIESGSPLLTVAVDNLRVLLLNSEAPVIAFQLAESSQVTRLTVLGVGAADLFGNSHSNVLIGNAASNLIDGGAGNDTVLGGGGDDFLLGGTGNDYLDGGAGWDSVLGGSGADILFADEGGLANTANTTPSLSSQGQSDMLMGGSGGDVLIAGASEVGAPIRMLGGPGADVFKVVSVAGVDGSADRPDLLLRAHVGDLTQLDGLDFSALRAGSVSDPGNSLGTIATRVNVASGGDATVSVAGLVVQGLQPVSADAASRPSAPFSLLASGSQLLLSTGSLVSSAEVASDLASKAISQGIALSKGSAAPYSLSSQEIFESVASVYVNHEQLLAQIYADLYS